MSATGDSICPSGPSCWPHRCANDYRPCWTTGPSVGGRRLTPHLFINAYTAVRTSHISHLWINQTLGVSAQAIREDRILNEAIATGGDIRRLCDLFGLSVKAAERYNQHHQPQ